MTPRTAVIVIFALVLLFSVLFNTLYTFIDIDSPWTSQYTNVTPRILMAIGEAFAGGVLFDMHRARYLGIVMFWMMLLSVGAMLGVEAGGPYVIGEVVYFLGTGVFMTFYTTVFIWIAQFLRAPDLWCSMGRALNNVTAIAIGAPALLVIDLTSPVAVVVLLIPLIIGINALLFVAGMLDLHPRPRGDEAAGCVGQQAGVPGSAGNFTPGQAEVSEHAPAADNATPDPDGSNASAQRAANGLPETTERPAPGTAPSADDAAIDPETHLADFAGRFAHAARDRGTCRRHRRRAPAQACGRGHGHLPARAPAAPDLALPEDRHAIPRRPHEAFLGAAPRHAPRAISHAVGESRGGYATNRQTPRNRSPASPL